MRYFALTAAVFRSEFAYRSQIWAAFFGQLIQVFARIAIWVAVLGSAAAAAGTVTLREMVTYAILSGTVLAAWQWQRLLNGIDEAIRSGDIATQLIKPVRYPLYLFFTELGRLFYRLLVVIVPVIVVAGLAYGLVAPPTLVHALAFALLWILSFVILFLMACLCGLLAFWLLTAFSIEWTLQGLIIVFSGTILPLWYMPQPLADIVALQPLAWLAYYPTAAYLGRLSETDIVPVTLGGLAWAAVLAAGVVLLWNRAARRIIVQGG